MHVPEMECFIVKCSNYARYAVKLFPKETCQCPSTSQCYHIVAAKISIGMSVAKKQELKYHKKDYNTKITM